MSEEDQVVWKAWLAGFFDGEGCITLQEQQGTFKQVRVIVPQKNQPDLMKKLEMLYGGLIQPDKVKSGMDRWHAFGVQTVRAFLQEIRPYLQVKDLKAEVALSILELSPGVGKRLNDKDKLLRYRLEELFESLTVDNGYGHLKPRSEAQQTVEESKEIKDV